MIKEIPVPEKKTHFKTAAWLLPLLSAGYAYAAYATTGLRNDHLLLIALVNISYFLSPLTRRFIIGFSIFLVYWIIFDSMKLWPNWSFHSVDILPLYNAEKNLFGINDAGIILTPNEYLLLHSSNLLDIISGSFYLCWIPLPLLFAFYLYNRHKNLFLRFSLAFFFVNCIGFVIYYSHPAAAPWYIAAHGTTLDTSTGSNAAGLIRFDRYFGITLFEDLYKKGSNVFAAMPSLHSSYPLIGFIYAMKQEKKWITIIFGIVMTGIWCSAIYLSHHYILDVLAGIACALTGVFILEKYILPSPRIASWFRRMEKAITPHSTRA